MLYFCISYQHGLSTLMKRLQPIALWLGALLVVAFALLFYESDLLWKVQQHNTFLNSSLYFKQSMVVPGGMLSWLGAYFTQHFYYPFVGVILICGWWLLIMWLTKRVFNIPDRWNVLALIPVAILIMANMNLDYWVYMIKLRGYFYVPTIGVTAGLALLWAFRRLPEKLWMRAAFIVLVALVGYPLMGTYALATVLLMGVLAWRLKPQTAILKSQIPLSVVALLSIVTIPLLYYHFVYYETNLTNIYRTALPVFAIREEYPDYYIPYYALAVCFLLFVITYRHEWKVAPVVQNRNNKKKQAKHNKTTLRTNRLDARNVKQWFLQGSVLAVIVVCVYSFWYKDANFHHELRMQRCIEDADWEGVVKEGTKQDGEPTRAIVMMHNLALSRLGRQCDEMNSFPKGSNKIKTPLPVYMCNIAGRLILYQYGLMNECHRSCMEDGVEYGWNVELLKYMARCAIFSKEPQAARKFLDLLRQTCYYGKWADRMEQLLNDPVMLASDSETGPITHMLHYGDRLDSVDGYVERYLMTTLAHHDSNDPYFQEQAVIGALWTREPDLFWPRFEHYLDLNLNNPIPILFQEAAYLFGNMEGQPWVEQLPLTNSVKNNYHEFMKQLQRYQSAPNAQMKRYLYDHFGSTYYFEYFFLRDITYY